MAAKIQSYRDLEIWQKGISIVKHIYRLTEKFPQKELYCLTTQMRRSSISIPSNIAEGFRRRYQKEYSRFLHISLGSCAELETQIEIAGQVGYIQENEKKMLFEDMDHLARMIMSLVKKLNTHDA
jgi:four helix bundle protein